MLPIRGAARTWAGRAGLDIGASHAGEDMGSMRVAEGIAASAQLLWDLIEPLQRVDGHLAAGNVERPARGMVAELVAAGLEVAAGTRGMRQSAQSLGGIGQLGSGLVAANTLA